MCRLSRLILATCCLFAAGATFATGHLSVGTKTLHLERDYNDPAFFDADGRERIFRGWNVSGAVKLASMGFKPFKSTQDAEHAFALMRQYTGANLVRFTLSWEGAHPCVDRLDTDYLDAIAKQIKTAIAENMYVFLDYHIDLYSRHLFKSTDRFTGNGAPRWIIEGGDYRQPGCSVLCFSWSMNTILNSRVRAAYRNFWDNAPVYTLVGERHVQDEFLWQLRETLHYLNEKFSPQEREFILGVQPFNEPMYGRGHADRADEFDNKKLWPFYRQVRAIMDETGWQAQWVYAEPQVFWHTNAGFFTPPTGGHFLRDIPQSGFVFAPHFYDAARMGVTNLNRVENAEYFPDIDHIREEARFLNMPVVIGEFGMWLHDRNGGSKDYARIVNATYQAMEISDAGRNLLDRRLDFYTLNVSGTQWHWDIYKDQHHEAVNGNPDRVAQQGDGWNDEDFSAIKGDNLSVDADVVGRIYPRAVQGRLVNFFYQPQASDGAGRIMDWAAIDTHGQRLFAGNVFALAIWQGTHSTLPTEIFLPPQFSADRIRVITKQGEWQPGQNDADIMLLPDREGDNGGNILQIHADSVNDRELHFALVLVDANEIPAALSDWLKDDIDSLRHPVFLTGRMADPNYVDDPKQSHAIQLDANAYQFLIFRQVVLQWQSEAPVMVYRNGKKILEAAATDRKVFFSLVGSKDKFQICQQDAPTQCSKRVEFH